VSPEAITGLATVGVSAVASVVLPLVVLRRTQRKEDEKDDSVTWEGINRAIVKERDQAEARHLREITAAREQHARDLHEMKANCDAQLAAARMRITFLEQEVERLNRQLYGPRGA
jgi:uncharacterized protein YwlG (UPF0340 family)